MNDTTLFRALLLSELLDFLKPLVVVLAALTLFYGALHVLRKRLEIKDEPPGAEPAMREDAYPLDSEFWPWYNALIANTDVSYDEARVWYALRGHKDVALVIGEPIAIEPEGETK